MDLLQKVGDLVKLEIYVELDHLYMSVLTKIGKLAPVTLPPPSLYFEMPVPLDITEDDRLKQSINDNFTAMRYYFDFPF